MATTHGSPTTDATPRALFMAPIRVTRIHCPRVGCLYVAVGENEGQAVRKVCGHILKSHTQEQADGSK